MVGFRIHLKPFYLFSSIELIFGRILLGHSVYQKLRRYIPNWEKDTYKGRARAGYGLNGKITMFNSVLDARVKYRLVTTYLSVSQAANQIFHVNRLWILIIIYLINSLFEILNEAFLFYSCLTLSLLTGHACPGTFPTINNNLINWINSSLVFRTYQLLLYLLSLE